MERLETDREDDVELQIIGGFKLLIAAIFKSALEDAKTRKTDIYHVRYKASAIRFLKGPYAEELGDYIGITPYFMMKKAGII